MKRSLVAFLLLICVIATAATSPSRRLRVASPKEALSVDDEGVQGVDSVDNKAEGLPVVDLKDGRKVLQKEENNDDMRMSSMKEKDYKQVILDLRGQIQERDATIEELRDEFHMKELNRRPDLQGDHVEPVLRFALKFVLLMQAASGSLEKKEHKAEPLVIGSNDFVADHLGRHKFLDDAIPKRVEAMQNQYKSQQDSRRQFAKFKGVSGTFMSSRAGLHRPRPADDDVPAGDGVPADVGLHPQEMVSLMYGFVRGYIKHWKIFVCLTTSTVLFYFTVSPGTNGPKSPRR
jgi:hypothetical protein